LVETTSWEVELRLGMLRHVTTVLCFVSVIGIRIS
jgi:hypothetical protein